MDILSILGITLAFAVIIGGNFIEGGSIHSLLNSSAALIVIGGTLAAAMLQTPLQSLKRSLLMFKWVFQPPYSPFKEGITKLVRWANAARKDGLLGLEHIAETEKDLFAKKGLQLLVDGREPDALRRILESDLILDEHKRMTKASCFKTLIAADQKFNICFL